MSDSTACRHRVLAGIELITAFYGCLYAGCIPVTVRPPHAQSLTATLPTVRMIVEVSNGRCRERGWSALSLEGLTQLPSARAVPATAGIEARRVTKGQRFRS